MGKKTKNILILSIIIFIFSIGTCLFLFLEINNKGVALENQMAILAENNNKESIYLNLRRTINETEEERKSISDKFFTDENEVISFLGEIESLAPEMGLDLKTQDLDRVSDKEKKSEYLKIVFTYKGNKTNVTNFVKLMENIPYHSYINDLSLKKISDGSWEGRLTIFITIQSV